uniref:tRNA (uracil-O(2)-)-methyltransferase n=1 Tax=Timema bartmani TaxID=61472 RepID=A0A7R9F4T8_9NEOP|nr:unnamed protein product [Timema bartmani]
MLKDATLLSSSPTTATREQFWWAAALWHNSPHLVNRRLYGSILLLSVRVVPHPDLLSLLTELDTSGWSEASRDALVTQLKQAGVEVLGTSDLVLDGAATNTGTFLTLTLKLLLPRNNDKFAEGLEVALFDWAAGQVTFLGDRSGAEVPSVCVSFPYSLHLEDGNITVYVREASLEERSAIWLKEHLLPRLVRWADSATPGHSSPSATSLSLVPVQEYNTLYQHLKKKYGKEMVKIWSEVTDPHNYRPSQVMLFQIWPEVTDPHKFVYEDVAIATYLLLVWKKEREHKGLSDRKQYFVDLGCGNGLLVHILTQEGHPGLGLDVRRRRIWDMYPSSTKLEVRTITPCASSLFPQADWLIGNHSDELTPWLPVIAARSSPSCCFFLLPCCAYEFDGSKYQRENSSCSLYSDYMSYVLSICEVCGFTTSVDRLRIPSTKRICFIGYERRSDADRAEKTGRTIQEFIDSRGSKNKVKNGLTSSEGYWSEFKPREDKEVVRNCTQLDKSLLEDIVSLVSRILLNKHRNISVASIDGEERMWNAGGCLMLNEVAKALPREKLKHLKKQCSGLQTLLKNHHWVFKVEKGTVQLRIPRRKSDITGTVCRTKPCWFHVNHPDGCLLPDDDCAYQHL